MSGQLVCARQLQKLPAEHQINTIMHEPSSPLVFPSFDQFELQQNFINIRFN